MIETENDLLKLKITDKLKMTNINWRCCHRLNITFSNRKWFTEAEDDW
jgi:hypothetical protein